MARMTPAQFAAYCRRVNRQLPRAIVAAEKETVKDVLKEALALSSGPLSLASLAAAGHPYARRAPNSSYAAQVINIQTGRFKASWQGVNPTAVGGMIVSKVTNDDKAAQFFDNGTSKMVARPISAQIVANVSAARLTRLTKAVQDALTP